MQVVAHETALDAVTDGVSLRAIYQEKARRGDASASAMLTGPEYPDELGYLHLMALELHGRSGIGQFGFAPLSYTTIKHYGELTRTTFSDEEVRGLIRLDGAMFPVAAESTPKEEPETSPVVRAWPTKKEVVS